uniref:Uncharacterized protein n=1 Tax=Elaeophora elaphi TaxID=1147741 RepID=A0A0R3RPD9_9BILA
MDHTSGGGDGGGVGGVGGGRHHRGRHRHFHHLPHARSVSRKSIICAVIWLLLSGLVMNCAEKLEKIE